MTKQNFVMASLTVEMRDKLVELKGNQSYTELLSSLLNIVKAFNKAFSTLDAKAVQKLFQIMQIELDKSEIKLLEKLVT